MSQHEPFHRPKVNADVSGIAMRALATVVSSDEDDVLLETNIQNSLLSALANTDWAHFDEVVEMIVATGVSREQIANHHIPTVARILGQAWVEDRMEFATVSIGCARLQGYLRRRGLDWCSGDGALQSHEATVLLIVPEFEQHTLGATLLAGQLRAQGLCVVTEFHASSDDIERATQSLGFDAILISSSRSETIALLCTMILKLKQRCRETPVVIGGNLLEQVPDVISKTGADFTANSWQGALEIIKSKAHIREADLVGCRG